MGNFEDVLKDAGMRHEKVFHSFGPFAYSRDEYRMWHNLHVGSWEVSLLPDTHAPCLHVTRHGGTPVNLRVEGDWTPPAWLQNTVETVKTGWATGWAVGMAKYKEMHPDE